MSKKKDRTPAEIVAIRKQRERRRVWRGWGLWFAWLIVFSVGYALNSEALQWFAFALCMVELAVVHGLYEKSLRKIADRPAADYNRIRKLEKRELPKGTGQDG